MKLTGTLNKAPVDIDLGPGKLLIALPDGPVEVRDAPALSEQVQLLKGKTNKALIVVRSRRAVVVVAETFLSELFACFPVGEYLRIEISKSAKHGMLSALPIAAMFGADLLRPGSAYAGPIFAGGLIALLINGCGVLRPTMPVFRVMTLVYLMFAAILLYVAIAWQKPWMYAFAAISLVIFVVKNGRYGFLAFLRRSVSQA